MTTKTGTYLKSLAAEWGTKIASRHLERRAIVYVRQSTQQQLTRHQESTRLQYGLVERAVALGWSRDRVEVIDDDLGCSGASVEGRLGFQRLVAEVGLDHVGIILGIEMSRLARSCRDWHQLLEVCALFDTLIADPDGTYDPGNYNDRLLLGLKGTMSEAELHILKRRMLEGKLAKARRGELGTNLPIGYVRRPSGEIVLEPDEGVREVVAVVFAQFEKRGTLNAVLKHLVDESIQMPVREYSGPNKGELVWRRVNRQTLRNMLKNPIYAGAYVYGRRPTDPRRKKPGRPATGRTVAGIGEWEVCIRDRLPAYISWARFEANQRKLQENQPGALGPPRNGPALLCGLLVCGRCGRRMSVRYGGGRSGRYLCGQEMATYGGLLCQSLARSPLDRAVEGLVLETIKPAALELSLRAAADIEAERDRSERLWTQRLERAQFEVQRARRQYDAVEPENRLVARTLERQLEEKLAALERHEEDHRRHLAKQPALLSAAEREEIRALAADIPAIWQAETTTAVDRQSIVRHLIDRIDVTVIGETERVHVTVHWAGGHQSGVNIVRPVGSMKQLSYLDDLIRRVQDLRETGLRWDAVAEQLNEDGVKPAKRRDTFTGNMLKEMMSRMHLSNGRQTAPRRHPISLNDDEWALPDLAERLGMPAITLFTWIKRGEAVGSKQNGRWVIRADKAELSRLRAKRASPGQGRPRSGNKGNN